AGSSVPDRRPPARRPRRPQASGESQSRRRQRREEGIDGTSYGGESGRTSGSRRMVGRSVNRGYRRHLNFLSPSDYAGWGRRYSRKLFRSIVRTATTPYDPSASSE